MLIFRTCPEYVVKQRRQKLLNLTVQPVFVHTESLDEGGSVQLAEVFANALSAKSGRLVSVKMRFRRIVKRLYHTQRGLENLDWH